MGPPDLPVFKRARIGHSSSPEAISSIMPTASQPQNPSQTQNLALKMSELINLSVTKSSLDSRIAREAKNLHERSHEELLESMLELKEGQGVLLGRLDDVAGGLQDLSERSRIGLGNFDERYDSIKEGVDDRLRRMEGELGRQAEKAEAMTGHLAKMMELLERALARRPIPPTHVDIETIINLSLGAVHQLLERLMTSNQQQVAVKLCNQHLIPAAIQAESARGSSSAINIAQRSPLGVIAATPPAEIPASTQTGGGRLEDQMEVNIEQSGNRSHVDMGGDSVENQVNPSTRDSVRLQSRPMMLKPSDEQEVDPLDDELEEQQTTRLSQRIGQTHPFQLHSSLMPISK
jgi:hypothetical protein